MSILFSTEKNTIVNNLTIVDGNTRTGKFFLANLISGMDDYEYFQYSFTLDILPYITNIGGIREDVAISTIRAVLDQQCYDYMIGRNINTRVDDRSSVLYSHEAEKYIARSKMSLDREDFRNSISTKLKPNYLFVQHNNLANIEIMFKALSNLKIIHLIRNPIDLVYSWFKKDYGKIMINNNSDIFNIGIAPSICGKLGPLPWYTHSIKSEYERINQIERIIISIDTLTKMCNEAMVSLPEQHRNRIMLVKYEKVVEDTNNVIDDISKFLGCKKSKHMNEIIKRQNCPNIIDVGIRDNKKIFLMKKISKKYIKLLEEMENNYKLNGNEYIKFYGNK